MKRIKTLNARAVAFAYHSLSYARRGSEALYAALEARIVALQPEHFDPHYLVKLLNAANYRNRFDSPLFGEIAEALTQLHTNLRYNEMIAFSYAIVQAPALWGRSGTAKDLFTSYEKIFLQFHKRLS